MQSYPDYGRYAAKVRDKDRGRTPLFYAIRYDAPEGVVELLLNYMNRMDILDCDRDGMSVLGLVWDKWVSTYEGKRSVAFYSKIFEEWKEHLEGCHGNEEKLGIVWKDIGLHSKRLRDALKGKIKEKWDAANKILRGAFRFDLKEKEGSDTDTDNDTNTHKWRILHAAAAIKCHASLFLMAAVLYPEQARELDCNDLFARDQMQHAPLSSLNPKNVLTALHFAAKSPTSGSESKLVLHQLLLYYPQAAKIKNPADASLPLHYLCANESKQQWVHDGIKVIYNAYPDAATLQDVGGRTPLHRAATLHDSSVLFIPPLQSFSGSGSGTTTPTKVLSSTRSYSSVDAIASSSITSARNSISSVEDPAESIIQNILSIHPDVASIPDFCGKLPMHSIAEYAENWDLNVQAVYEAFPEALSRRELSAKCLPLHLVSSNLDAKPYLIQKLVEYNPRAASLVNGDGRLPLHLACEAGKSGGLGDIFNAFPSAINIAEENGRKWMPLHFVVSSPYSSLETIEKVLGLGPDVAHIADQLGRTPFHLAIESGKGWEDGGLESLFQANPEAIDVPDGEGKIPLVTALLSYCSNQGVVSNDVKSSSAVNLSKPSCSLQPLDEHATITQASAESGIKVGEAGDAFGTDLAQINVLFHLLRTAPHVLGPLD